MSKYMVSLIADESVIAAVTPEEMETIVSEMNEFNGALEKAGVVVGGDGLGPSSCARTLRYGEDGDVVVVVVVTDGPYAESKEQIAGYWIFECADLDEAVEWARKAPIRGGVTEVRAIVETAEENFEAYKKVAGR
ncbi:MAG: YciI family protein [Solirubrobacterales bacterium]|nr:YciI family protein [Solirubrobacterales bacterium]